MFKQKEKLNYAVGLDIGNSSIKVVQLCAQPDSAEKELVNLAVFPVRSQERNEIIQAIKQVMREAKITNNLMNTSVGGQSVIVRYIQMPKMSRQDLKNSLKFELAKYIPFKVEEVNFDFEILEDNKNKDNKFMRVLLVAVKKDLIEERIKILQEAGCVPNIIDVDFFAIINSFQLVSQEKKGFIAVLDIGADTTSIACLNDNMPFFNRDIPYGGNQMNKAIVEEFELTPQQAEELKRNPQNRYNELINVLTPGLNSLCKEIQLSFNFCESQLGSSVQKIYLTGGTAKFKGIDKVLNNIMGVDVEVWDPLQRLKIGPNVVREQIADIGPLMTVAVGLALRS